MTREKAAARLETAEHELQRAQLEHDGSDRATVRYQAARQELEIAEALARALLRR